MEAEGAAARRGLGLRAGKAAVGPRAWMLVEERRAEPVQRTVAKDLDALSQMIVEAVQRATPRVVGVTATDAEGKQVAAGTGYLLDDQYVLVQASVAAPELKPSLLFWDGRRLEGELVAADPLYFVAVLRLQEEVAAPPLPPAPREELRPGLLLAAVGDPFDTDRSVTLGVLSTPDWTFYRRDRIPVDGLILVDAVAHAGNLGGPLVTLEGKLAGINGVPGTGGLNVGLRVDVVQRLTYQMITHGRASHPWLGFSGETEVVPPAMGALLGVPVRSGVAVSRIQPGGPGARAGVQPLDMVVRVGEHPVDSLGAVRQALAMHRPGETAKLVVLRGSELVELEMPVEEVPKLPATPWEQQE